jgi:hypothetical protein
MEHKSAEAYRVACTDSVGAIYKKIAWMPIDVHFKRQWKVSSGPDDRSVFLIN